MGVTNRLKSRAIGGYLTPCGRGHPPTPFLISTRGTRPQKPARGCEYLGIPSISSPLKPAFENFLPLELSYMNLWQWVSIRYWGVCFHKSNNLEVLACQNC